MKTSKQEQNLLKEQGKKRCSKCVEIKVLEDFSKDRNTPDGFASHCKECHRIKDRKRISRPEVIEKRKEQYKQDPEKYRKRHRGKRNPNSYIRPARGTGHRIAGHIYIFCWNSIFKIGRAINPQQRAETINCALPSKGVIIHVIHTNDMVDAESSLHKKFSKKRLGGEWFSLSDDDVGNLRCIKSITFK